MKKLVSIWIQSYQDVGLIGVSLFSFLGDQEQFVEQEQRSLIFGSLDTERSLKNQFTIANEIWPLPVSQQTLNLLKE